MARPNKQGLEYFPLDVDFFDDEKIEAISGEFGMKGELATVKLLCAVYRNGYFAIWNDLLKNKLLKRLPGVSPELLEQIVNRLVLWGFFDKSLFDSDKVLTSNGIQKRFFEATKRRKEGLCMQYVINNHPRNELMSTLTPKEKKSKEKKSKELPQQFSLQPPKPNIPTKEQVHEYFVRQGSSKELSERFFGYYDGTGWMKGSSAIVKWTAMADIWIANPLAAEKLSRIPKPTNHLKNIDDQLKDRI